MSINKVLQKDFPASDLNRQTMGLYHKTFCNIVVKNRGYPIVWDTRIGLDSVEVSDCNKELAE